MHARTVTHPLIDIVRRAQHAVTEGRKLMGPSKADTIATLHDVLCTGPAEDAIANTARYTEVQVSQAQARFLPALETAHHRLGELRKHYDGTMGVTLDREIAQVGAMLAVAREAASK